MHSVGIITDRLFALHSNGRDHPESPARVSAVRSGIERTDDSRLRYIDPRPASREELEWVHTQSYVDRIGRTSRYEYTALDYETRTNTYTYDAARAAVGGTIEGVEMLFAGEIGSFFAAVRPPGHHAERARAMGFCIFNTIAIAAEHALNRRNLDRVLIVDWDVHHGNGTMHTFYDSASVLYISIHQFPHYPGTGRIEDIGKDEGEGYTVNVPLPPGCGDQDYDYVFNNIVIPVAEEYAPELVLVSAGYDPDKRDPLAGMELTSTMFGRMTAYLISIAAGYSSNRIGVVLEGGYNVQALENGVHATIESLCRESDTVFAEITEPPTTETKDITGRCAETLSRYWKRLSG